MGAQLGKKGFVAEINVTPFVDVMLVLLIIFMVTAPMMTEWLEVNLPQTQAVDTLPTGDNTVILTVKADGSLFLNDVPTGVETLGTQLLAVVKNQNKSLFLNADKDVPYGVVVGIMGRVKAAGIENLGIVAQRIDDLAPDAAAPGQVPPQQGRGR